MENKVSPTTIRIGDSSSLDKKRIVNTSAGCYLVRKVDNNVELLVIEKQWENGDTKCVLPKGHKEGEESLEETALRETREESGYIDIKLLRYLGSSTYELDWSEIQIKTDHYFLAVLCSNKQVDKQAEDYEEGVVVENKWVGLEEGLSSLTFENNPEIHKLLKQYIEEGVLE